MNKLFKSALLVSILSVIVSACGVPFDQNQSMGSTKIPTPISTQNLIISQPDVTTTPLPARPQYSPGELVDYVAQNGDTLASLASHFNTSVDEILSANSFIPADATTIDRKSVV